MVTWGRNRVTPPTFFGFLFALLANYDYFCKLFITYEGIKCRKSVQSSAQSYKNIVKSVIRNRIIADNFSFVAGFARGCAFGSECSYR